jgi:hypothetical protein
MRIVFALAIVLLSHSAHAACKRALHPGLLDGPVVVGLQEADLATGRRACPRSEIQVGARAAAIIAAEAFYGNLRLDAMVSGSWSIRGRGELFATLALVHWEFAQNATIKGDALGIGPLTLGGSWVAFEGDTVAVTPYARAMLPTASLGVPTLGLEAGVAFSARPHRRVELHGFMAGDVTAGFSAAPTSVRKGATFSLGAQAAPWTWLAIALDLHMQFGHRAGFDLFALSPALRFRLWRGLSLEGAVMAPVAGADRHDVAFALRLGSRL